MAVGFAIANGGSQSQYNGRITSYLVLSCLVAAMGAFIFGYDIGVSGFSLSFIVNYYHKNQFPVQISKGEISSLLLDLVITIKYREFPLNAYFNFWNLARVV